MGRLRLPPNIASCPSWIRHRNPLTGFQNKRHHSANLNLVRELDSWRLTVDHGWTCNPFDSVAAYRHSQWGKAFLRASTVKSAAHRNW
ncbi:Uncharacterised protein [Vibrio cholerae]|nr:Uncharacterised protein [Vibrio cholerae]CSI52108.1 Uncharacterised protein [Vibrio cholerae]